MKNVEKLLSLPTLDSRFMQIVTKLENCCDFRGECAGCIYLESCQYLFSGVCEACSDAPLEETDYEKYMRKFAKIVIDCS